MFEDAFTGAAVGGGITGAIVNGFKRAAFSNEAGLGSAPIAHSAAKTKEPVREGAVALLEPFVDTIIICFMTGIVITVTGVYQNNIDGQIGGVMLTSQAFATVIDWFPIVLSIAVV
jgi:AGCS family alanine or glycine:cation symporter